MGFSKCSICDALFTEADVAADNIVCTTHFIPHDSHPLWQYSDSCMHKVCFLGWPHRAEFAALCMLAVRHDHLLKLLGLNAPAESLVEWQRREDPYFGLLEWESFSDAWVGHMMFDDQSFKVCLQSEPAHRMFPFRSAARSVQALLAKLGQLRERAEIKANELVVVDRTQFESDEPTHMDASQWAKALLAEMWISPWGSAEVCFQVSSLPNGTYLTAMVDSKGRIQAIERRLLRPDLGDR